MLQEIENKSFDLIFIDPPYQALKDLYKNWNDNLDFQVYGEFFDRILKDTGQIATFCDYMTSVQITTAFSKFFRFRFWWCWNKPLGQIVSKKQPISDCELTLVFCKKKAFRRDLTFNYKDVSTPRLPYQKKMNHSNKTRKKHDGYITSNEDGLRFLKQILSYPTKCNLPERERFSHPTMKPVNLCGYVIKALSSENDLILDCFSGSGSISISAFRLKRNFIGIEKDPEYYRESVKRLEVYHGWT